MKDMLGVEVEVGDVIVSASGQGHHKVGKVYGFNRSGLAMIEAEGLKWDRKLRKHTKQWMKVSSGWSVLVVGRDGEVSPSVEEAINRKYPSDPTDVG